MKSLDKKNGGKEDLFAFQSIIILLAYLIYILLPFNIYYSLSCRLCPFGAYCGKVEDKTSLFLTKLRTPRVPLMTLSNESA